MNKANSTRVPNHILDASLRTLKEVELKVLLVIIRQTIGWNKPSDWIATSQMCLRTGASTKAIRTAVKSLTIKGLITVHRKDGQTFYALQEEKNLPIKRKNVPLSREQSSFGTGKNLPPTKDTFTKDEKVSADKIQSIRESLVALGVLKSVV